MKTLHATPQQVKSLLRERDITYRSVAAVAGVSWRMVYLVVSGKRTSAPVLGVISRLVGKPIGRVKGR